MTNTSNCEGNISFKRIQREKLFEFYNALLDDFFKLIKRQYLEFTNITID